MSRDARELATDLQCYADVCERAINEGFESMRRLIPNPERLRAAAALLAQSKAAPQEQLTQLTSGSIAKTTPAIPASAAPASGEGVMTKKQIEELRWLANSNFELTRRVGGLVYTVKLAPLADAALSLREKREGMVEVPRILLADINTELCALISPPFDDAPWWDWPEKLNSADRLCLSNALLLVRQYLTAPSAGREKI